MSDLERKQAASEWLKELVAEESTLGRLSMIGGAALRLAVNLVDAGLTEAGKLVDEAREAFLDALEPDPVEDAKILVEEIKEDEATEGPGS
ncbi:MAG TPA: hypothetical protein DIW24_08525 [Bacteroidetes bacterium]|nr:hypothetical protein [Bacteroidota bacterium]HRR07621.1 hypothetical protein [Rhodothermales bacterium]